MIQVLEKTYLCEQCNTNRVECWTEPCQECQARNLQVARKMDMYPTGGNYKIVEGSYGSSHSYDIRNDYTPFSTTVATICPHGKDEKGLAADAVLVGYAREMFELIQSLATSKGNISAAWLLADMDAKYRELLEEE